MRQELGGKGFHLPGVQLQRKDVRAMLVVAAAAILAWAPSLGNGFVWLDHTEIEEGGYRVRSPEDFQKVWSWSLGAYLEREQVREPAARGAYFRPVYALANTVSWALWGARTWWWHLETVLWHVLVVVLLYRLGTQAGPGDDKAWHRAVFWATLIFAVHPLGEQSVAWISGRKDSMAVAFSLLTLLAFLRCGDGQERHPVKQWRFGWAAGGLAALALALGCKEAALVVPLLVTALVVTRSWKLSGGLLQKVFLAAMWALAGGFALYRASVTGGLGLGAPSPETSVAGRAMMSATVLWDYVVAIVVPRPGLLSDAWPLSAAGSGPVLSAIALVAGLTLLGIGAVRNPALRFPTLWFLAWLLPASGATPLWHFRAERYLYPASWGLLLAIALGLQWALARVTGTQQIGPRLAGGIFGTVSAIAFLVTWSALPRWNADATLFADAVKRDPNHAEAHFMLGEAALKRGDFAQAESRLRAALAVQEAGTHTVYLAPFIVRTDLGTALYRQGRFKEALEEFVTALSLRSGNAAGHYHVGLAALAIGRFDLAETAFREALQRDPGDPLATANLAVTLMRKGDLEGCVETYRPLIESGWDDRQGWHNYGSALLALKRFGEARDVFAQVLERDDGDALSLAKLAWCQDALGDSEAARATAREALALDAEDRIVQDIARRVGAAP